MSQDTQPEAEIQWRTENLTVSEYHELLAAARRRTTLDILASSTAPIDLAELAARVAGQEANGEVTEEKTVERVALSLHHVHLPKMDELGVIGYDQDTTSIESCPDAAIP